MMLRLQTSAGANRGRTIRPERIRHGVVSSVLRLATTFVRRLGGCVAIAGILTSACASAADLPKAEEDPIRVTREMITSPATNQVPADLPEHLRRGFELAHVYCQACHLFPEPDYLTKDTWINGALRLMALRLGAAKLNYDKHPDGPILKEAGVFPNEPLISEQDWFAICQFFKERAPEKPLPQPPHAPIRPGLNQFQVREIRSRTGDPWTTLVKINSPKRELFLGDAQARSLSVLDANGQWLKSIPVDSGPVSMLFRDSGAYITLIGRIFPSDQLEGKIVFLERNGPDYVVRTILDRLRRPTDVLLADLNGDGRDDFIVSEFGSVLGRFSWFENLGNGRFEQHTLLDRPGAIRALALPGARTNQPAASNSPVKADAASPRQAPDFIVLTAQAREGLYLFHDQGQGEFDLTPIAEYPPVWGSTYFEFADFNHDGLPDLLVTNGDSGDYVSPTKRFHGIRIYLNEGNNRFREAFFYPLNGAFKAMAGDFNGDGELDIAAISFFPDYVHEAHESFVFLQARGGLQFDAYSIPEALDGRWLTMDIGDLNGDGALDIVLGSFIHGPVTVPIPRALEARWHTNQVSALILQNVGRAPAGARKQP